jgi:hypothetical protein
MRLLEFLFKKELIGMIILNLKILNRAFFVFFVIDVNN